MSDQVLTMMYISPTGNTLPTTGTTANLTGTQMGIFLPDYTPATVGNVANAKYIFFAQNRNIIAPGEGTRKSDFIYPKNLINWYKVTGNLQVNPQIVRISDLNAGCEQDISISLRLMSYYVSSAYFNGLTRSVMVTTPCCDCGANPCDTLSGAQIQQVMQDLAQAINDDDILGALVTAGTQGTLGDTDIIIQTKAVATYGQSTTVDPTNYPYMYDRVYFWTFVGNGPQLTTDYEVWDACNEVADVEILQRASYPRNTPAEVKQLEKDFFSYGALYKDIFADQDYNGEYTTYVDSALAYDLYYLQFWKPKTDGLVVLGEQPQDEWVLWAVPKGDSSEAGTLAILTAIFGAPDDLSSTPTSTTSYTTSLTTSTTTVFPGGNNTP